MMTPWAIFAIVFSALLSLINGLFIYARSRKDKLDQEKEERLVTCESEIQVLKSQQLTEERLRSIIRSELESFELRMLKSGQMGYPQPRKRIEP